jgi:hypothetical protein
MASLKTLLFTNFVQLVPVQEFAVYNTSTYTLNNGGQCCAWTIPTGVTWIEFEMWGGGGSGAGALCCQQGCAGGGGSYAIRRLEGASIVPGCVYTICAAGSTCTPSTCCGFPGNTSFVSGFNLGTFCARGGCRGNTNCFGFCCYNIASIADSCCAVSCNLPLCAYHHGGIRHIYCVAGLQQMAGVGTGTVSGPIYGPSSGCSIAGCGDCTAMTPPVFPGGGGLSAQTHGGVCTCGWWGAGGLVLVKFG